MSVDEGPKYAIEPIDPELAQLLPEKVLFRIVRRDGKGRPFGTPRNPRAPTLDDFNPRIAKVRAGDLAAIIVRRRHGILPVQAERIAQFSYDELIQIRVDDPISATIIDGGLSLTGGHHRTNEIIQRVHSSQIPQDAIIEVLIHD